MTNLNKPLFTAALLMASALSITAASAHGKQHGSMRNQAMSGQMMPQNQMRQRGTMRISRMQHRQNHRMNPGNRMMGTHQKMERHDTTANDPDFQRAFSDE